MSDRAKRIVATTGTHRSGLLTVRQRLFVEYYCKLGCPVKAAREAGYEHPERAGPALTSPSRFPDVVGAINYRLAQLQEACLVDAKRIVEELAKIAFFNIKDLLDDDGYPRPLSQISHAAAASISHMRVSYSQSRDGTVLKSIDIKFHPKLEALKQLAQHLGLLKDMTINNTLVQVINWDDLLGARTPRDAIEERIDAIQAPLPKRIQATEVIDSPSSTTSVTRRKE